MRPHVRIASGDTREIRWPDHEFFAISAETRGFDLVIGLGVEPQLRWRSFSAAIVELAQRVDAKLVILLGAFLDEVIYSQPIQVIGTSSDAELVARLGLAPSRYEGPTGIVGVLGDALQTSGIPSLSLWARLPHYVQETPNSRAALALLQRVESITGFPLDKSALETAAASFDQEVSEAIAADPQLSAYVRELKRRAIRRTARARGRRCSEAHRASYDVAARRGRAVERVEVQPRRAAPEQLAALRGGPLDADLERALVVVAGRVERAAELFGNARAAQRASCAGSTRVLTTGMMPGTIGTVIPAARARATKAK